MDKIVQLVNFPVQWDKLCFTFVQHIPQESRQLKDHFRGPGRILDRKSVNIVEIIKQEMRVDLRFQKLKFAFLDRALEVFHLALFFEKIPRKFERTNNRDRWQTTQEIVKYAHKLSASRIRVIDLFQNPLFHEYDHRNDQTEV